MKEKFLMKIILFLNKIIKKDNIMLSVNEFKNNDLYLIEDDKKFDINYLIKQNLAIDWLSKNYNLLDLYLGNIKIVIQKVVIKPQKKYVIDLTRDFNDAQFICVLTANLFNKKIVSYEISVLINYLIDGTIVDKTGLFNKEIGCLFK